MTNVKNDKPAAIGDRAFEAVCTRIKVLRGSEQAVITLMRDHSRQLAERVYGPEGRMTMREAGRRAGLSPAYLSQVLHGRPFSPSAFQRVSALLKGK